MERVGAVGRVVEVFLHEVQLEGLLQQRDGAIDCHLLVFEHLGLGDEELDDILRDAIPSADVLDDSALMLWMVVLMKSAC